MLTYSDAEPVNIFKPKVSSPTSQFGSDCCSWIQPCKTTNASQSPIFLFIYLFISPQAGNHWLTCDVEDPTAKAGNLRGDISPPESWTDNITSLFQLWNRKYRTGFKKKKTCKRSNLLYHYFLTVRQVSRTTVIPQCSIRPTQKNNCEPYMDAAPLPG